MHQHPSEPFERQNQLCAVDFNFLCLLRHPEFSTLPKWSEEGKSQGDLDFSKFGKKSQEQLFMDYFLTFAPKLLNLPPSNVHFLKTNGLFLLQRDQLKQMSETQHE